MNKHIEIPEEERWLDVMRERAIRIMGKLLVKALARKHYRTARRIEMVWRRLIKGRSAGQVTRMERRMGLR